MGLRKVKLVDREAVLPFETGTGADIKEALGIRPDRQLAMRTPTGLVDIGERQRTEIPEGAEIIDVPFAEYGASAAVGHRLRQECQFLSEKYGQTVTCGFDPDIDRWWVHLPALHLPAGWRQRTTPVIVTVTDHYPVVAPDGFLLASNLTDRHGFAPGHYYASNGRHPKLTSQGYGWFCIHPRGWTGDLDFRDGDSIAKYLSLIEIALAHVVRS